MPKRRSGVADRETVFAVIDDMIADLLIHDRRNDEDLPEGEVERLIQNNDLSIDDMVERFRESLEEHLEDLESSSGDDDENPGPLETDDEDD